MPLFEYLCLDCGKVTEFLALASSDQARCGACDSLNVKKLISAPSSASGLARTGLPGPGDHTCCGSAPGQAAGCAGPGSCCGKTG